MSYEIRNFENSDRDQVNRVALAAFNQYQGYYSDWDAFSKNISNMASLSEQAELIVAVQDEVIIGAVAYVPSGITKNLFPIDWPVIRMLVVDPNYRNHGIGKQLTEKCIERAIQDRASFIALHTSPIMEVALKMYLRMGFVFEKEAPFIYGVPYNIYVKNLT
jgi:ribosomal protein S18 acetylase RimI-like enzyme